MKINYLLGFLFLLAIGCSKDDVTPPPPIIIEALPISNLQVSDVADNNDGRDLEIVFNKVSDEAKIKEYRIIVVKENLVATFKLESAQALATDTYHSVAKTGSNIRTTLKVDAKDSGGDLIAEDIPYQVIIWSVADGTIATKDKLSDASAIIELRSINIGEAPSINNLAVEDVADNKDASDMQVSFSKAFDETLLREYRVLVSKEDQTENLDLESAQNIEADRYQVIAKTGSDIQVNLDTSLLDTDGDAIVEDVAYQVLVWSVADGINATIDILSDASAAITLRSVSIVITYIGNDGVFITDGEKKVIIDALAQNLQGWRPTDPATLIKLKNGEAPYDNVDISMITHNHGDHFNTTNVNTFSSNNPNAVLFSPPGIRGNFNPAQVNTLTPDLHTTAETTVNGIPVKILHMKHFAMFGMPFATTQNYSYLIEIGGKKVLHLGDFGLCG